jgi:hypothetical protein
LHVISFLATFSVVCLCFAYLHACADFQLTVITLGFNKDGYCERLLKKGAVSESLCADLDVDTLLGTVGSYSHTARLISRSKPGDRPWQTAFMSVTCL